MLHKGFLYTPIYVHPGLEIDTPNMTQISENSEVDFYYDFLSILIVNCLIWGLGCPGCICKYQNVQFQKRTKKTTTKASNVERRFYL